MTRRPITRTGTPSPSRSSGPEPEGLFTYNIRDGCCLKYLGGGRFNDLQPNFSPDGEWLVFVSTRLRFSTPQVYLRPLAGGDDELLSPFRYGEGGFFTDPDWSPCGDRVAFAGGIGSRRQANRYHILVAKLEAGGNRLLQLTQEGNNEDPSWAPNCRHIVFTGERSYGKGVFIVDTVTGRTRVLVANVEARGYRLVAVAGRKRGGQVRGLRGRHLPGQRPLRAAVGGSENGCAGPFKTVTNSAGKTLQSPLPTSRILPIFRLCRVRAS